MAYNYPANTKPIYIGNVSGAQNIVWGNNVNQSCVLTEATNFTFSGGQPGYDYNLNIVMDGVGGYAVTWPNTVLWPSATAPTMTTFAGTTDMITFHYTGSYYLGTFILDIR